jgi:RHS repeat-associated protein
MTSAGGTSITYDANQNTASALGSTYGYDAAGQLTSATIGGTGYTFGYDPQGRLYSSAGVRFRYAGMQLVGEYNSAGTLLTRHVPGPGLDQPVATLSGGARYQQIADERGSVVGVADPGGTVNINRYDEYGVPSAGDRFQYTGQAWMAPGIYNYRARAYAPQLGRFLQTDPIGYAAGPNVYGYVGGDPVNLSDPSGTDVCQILVRYTYTLKSTGEVIRRVYRWEAGWCENSTSADPRDVNIGISSPMGAPSERQEDLCRNLSDTTRRHRSGLEESDVWSRNWNSLNNISLLASIAEATYENDQWGEFAATIVSGVGLAAAGRWAATRAAGTRFSSYATFARHHQGLNDGLLGVIGAGAGNLFYSMSRQRSEDRYRALEARANYIRAGCND